MDTILKQRLIGAVVLISLAVIFLPMVFTGDGQFSSRFRSNVPEEPNFEIVAPQVHVPKKVPSKLLPKVPLIEPVAQPEPAEIKADPRVAQGGKPDEQKLVKKDSSQKIAAPVQAKKAVKSKPDINGWVIQLGSFYKKNNAVKLRDKLRKKGLSSFLVTGKGKNGPIYRVRIGPELERQKANKILQEVEKDTKLKGLVLRYP